MFQKNIMIVGLQTEVVWKNENVYKWWMGSFGPSERNYRVKKNNSLTNEIQKKKYKFKNYVLIKQPHSR